VGERKNVKKFSTHILAFTIYEGLHFYDCLALFVLCIYMCGSEKMWENTTHILAFTIYEGLHFYDCLALSAR